MLVVVLCCVVFLWSKYVSRETYIYVLALVLVKLSLTYLQAGWCRQNGLVGRRVSFLCICTLVLVFVSMNLKLLVEIMAMLRWIVWM